jgi:hypothetical protein
MGIGNSRQQSTQANQRIGNKEKKSERAGIVYEVILDENNEAVKDSPIPSTQKVGAIKFRLGTDTSANAGNLSIAYPKNLNFKSLPLKNEIVTITNGANGNFFYERNGTELTPNNNADSSAIKTNYDTDKKAKKVKSSTYASVFQHGIARSSNDSSKDNDGYGDYFISDPNVHKLKLYEGDSWIESRFGQSLRFSAYNNSENSQSPTIILRNGENSISKQNDETFTTEEDVNRDGTIILLGSNEYELPFQPGIVDDNGTSDFETSPSTFRNYPSILKGDQLLLNSGRIIISAKNAEMIFYSKKNYGFISDGWLSIDNKFGIEVNVGDNINVETNDRDINLNTGNGKINLGNQNLESIVRGETLVDLLSQLVDAITQQIYLTPAGPTSPGPTNVAAFQKIKSQLRTMLSDLNKTS